MVLTPSTMLPLGTPLPAFSLAQVAGAGAASSAASGEGSPGTWRTAGLSPQPVLVLFLCAHCPFVKHIEPELSRLERDYGDRVQIVAISSNSTRTHPQDGPAGLRAQAERCGWRFPYLFDADQSVARAFQAACTPDLFLFGPADPSHQLVYRGQLDASRPGSSGPQAARLDGRDLRAALDALLAGQPVDPQQTPSIGCNIKWHPDG
jgi:thiol-disulfide isomerase/thioredoxin